ncbi:MAG TPA: alpha/beta fold hydrolase [Anaerolineales bacterium]|nr:alpha/beta fold hydrolase [Anaerolineales bacterium]
MFDVKRLIYLHGSESDSKSGKARQFREWFPGMLTPDFKGPFEERMSQLHSILSDKTNWTLIGSSLGGLMGVTFAQDHPTQVRKLILLAPALTLDPFASRSDPSTLPSVAGQRLQPVSVPTIVVHGTLDTVVPLEPVREIIQMVFTDVRYYIVNDDHRLHKTLHELDWKLLFE